MDYLDDGAGMTAYLDFVASKGRFDLPTGLVSETLNGPLFPFQRDVTKWALKRGRAAIFAGTGLGKTLMQLSWADAIRREIGGKVLILTPLAVAQQTVSEARKFGIFGAKYHQDGRTISPITVTNYDRIEKFDLGEFVAIVLDESSIIKSHNGKTRALLTELTREIKYKLCCTATPAPNDYVELGQHAEFLGVMLAKEMLSTWFVHDGSNRATNVKNKGKPVANWRLKGHAEKDFWRWVASWAMLVRKPSDLGYDDDAYALPPLVKRQITVPVEYSRNGMLFDMAANTLSERLQARKKSILQRCAAAAELVNAHPDQQWLVWCHLNAEEEAITALIPGAIPVRGSDDRELKAERLLGFADGDVRILCSKPSLAGFGMNFQGCHNMVFCGLNDSFEQLYQAIRRCWRFGQKHQVNVFMIASELEGAVVKNLEEKEAAFDRMSDALAAQVREYQDPKPRRIHSASNHKGSVPAWL